MQALLGKKLGMLSVFDDEGRQVPVTAIEVGPCVVVQKKTADKDGYDAVQLGFQAQKESRLTKPAAGHFKKAGAPTMRVLREVRAGDAEVNVGDQVGLGAFDGVAFVDVIGTSKGRGFQGVVKRHNMSGGRASHGSGNHRAPGSIGMCVNPARVLKGKKMPGHMGHRRITTQNLKVIAVREEDNVLLVRGAVAGPNGGIVVVRRALKKTAGASS
jgi:large subunit ribosomal protein L3